MISVIVCSANNKLYETFEKNVAASIGVEHEMIRIYNADGKIGISEAYNIGVAKSAFPYLCFIHEDALLMTDDWGRIVVDLFQKNTSLGLLGVAGAKYKSSIHSGWAVRGFDMDAMNLMQGFKDVSKEPVLRWANPENARLQKVVTLDGVFLSAPKKIFEQFSFDQKTFKKFHCYDVDFSLQVSQSNQYDAAVTFDILLTHFSEGGFNVEWFDETIKLQDKWDEILPVSIDHLTKEKKLQIDLLSLYLMKVNVLRQKMPISKYLSQLWKRKVYQNIGLREFMKHNFRFLRDSILQVKFN
jgi:hypothetical protein